MELLLGYIVARGRKMVYMGGRPAGAVDLYNRSCCCISSWKGQLLLLKGIHDLCRSGAPY